MCCKNSYIFAFLLTTGCCEWWMKRSKKVATLEFDRIRKSMSAIVREQSGCNRLLVKVIVVVDFHTIVRRKMAFIDGIQIAFYNLVFLISEYAVGIYEKKISDNLCLPVKLSFGSLTSLKNCPVNLNF